MTITLNGTTGITTPSLTSDAGIIADGISFADGTPSNTLVTNTSGNIGIGTNTPQNGGSFSKVASIYNATNCALSIGNGNRHYQWGVGTSISDGIGLYDATAGAYRMLIDSSGAILMGKTAVDDTTAGWAWRASGYMSVVRASGGVASFNRQGSAGANIELFFQNSACGNISVNTNSTTYNTSSDYRLKQNIAPMTGALDKVLALKPVTYTWIADGSASEGFVAHELAEVCPLAVTGEKDAVDEDGKPVYQGIDQSRLVATLTAAIQEQQAIITDLKARIETLENK